MRAGPRRVPLRPQGVAAHHAPQAPQGRGRGGRLVLPRRRRAGPARRARRCSSCRPNLKKDLPRLEEFLAVLPERARAAFEFRHASWFEDDVFEALRSRGAALCIAEDEELATPLVATAGWGYLRLRRQDYDEAAVAAWAEKIRAQAWNEAYAFFKHEDSGTGPRLAAVLAEKFAGAAAP